MTQSSSSASLIEEKIQSVHPNCFVCAPHRPFGLRVNYVMQADNTVQATVACPKLWEGYPGMVHGGITASLIDGAMTHCLFGQDINAVTADLHVRYRLPLILGKPATITAEVTNNMPPLYVLKSTLTQDGKCCVTATGKFMDRRYINTKETAS